MAQVGTLVAGGLVAIGGLIGYLKAGSVPSLVAGVVVGALYGLSTLHMEPDQTLGNAAAVLVSIVLSIQMGKRYLASQKAMAGVVAAMGVSIALLNAIALYHKHF